MQEMQPWHYVVATEAMLATVGVTQATAVQYDTTRDLFELLDDSAGCNEWVVRTADNNQLWIDRFNAKFGIAPIYMDDSMIRDFDADHVHINSAGQRLLFTAAMERDFEKLMNAVL